MIEHFYSTLTWDLDKYYLNRHDNNGMKKYPTFSKLRD